jgi:RHS repeat-associated protein
MSDPAGIYLRARTLDPATGLFLSTDPVRPGAPGVVGYNQYSYVGNNPTTSTDPTGLFLAEEGILQFQTVRTAPPAIAIGVGLRMILLQMALVLAAAGTVCLLVCDVYYPPTTVGDPPITGPNVDVDELLNALRRIGKAEITRDIAETIAATCVASKVAAIIGNVGDLCSGRRMPIFFTGGDVLAASAHDLDAIVLGHRSPLLNVLRNGPPGLPRGWYGLVRYGRPCVAPPGSLQDCDEYPFYATAQAGPGADLLVMPRGPNRSQGTKLQQFYNGCELPDGTEFAVIPIPVPGIPTTGICR